MKRVAIPLNGDLLSAHFGHCEKFGLYDIQDNEVVAEKFMIPPPHEPGVLPKWLAEQGANEILAGGMGQRAISILEQNGVHVNLGVSSTTPVKQLLDEYIQGELKSGGNSCDH